MKKRYLLALAHINGLGPKTLQSLLSHFGDPRDCLAAPLNELKALRLSEQIIKAIKSPDWATVDKALKWSEEEKHNHLITWMDQSYPILLKQISTSPPMLFLKGDANLLSTPQIAMVGSRLPSPGGLKYAALFSSHLSQRGLSITSGLAKGIDITAHQAALKSRGKTIAVLGTGINRIYPFQNKKTADQMIDNGLLISEFPMDTPPKAHHFPRRNRLISGLSLGVLVVEAAIKSGSLITARYALEQGREVFAVPGALGNPMSKGCHYLIQQGAKLTTSVEDILVEFPASTVTQHSHLEKNTPKTLEQSLQNLVQFVDYEVTSVDAICAKSGLLPQQIAQQLIDLEVKGLIKAVPGGYMRF